MTQDQIKEIQQKSESETLINSRVEDTFTVTIPVPVGLASPVPVAVHDPSLVLRKGSLVSAFLSGRNERTISAYRQDLEDFRAFVKVESMDESAWLLLSRGHGAANALALAYKTNLLGRRLQAATINRRLAALRSLVKMARTLGKVLWSLEVGNLNVQPYRDTRGPGRVPIRRVLAKLDQRLDPKAKRDRALIRLLSDLALRVREVVSLDLEHIDLQASTISVLGKGRCARETISLPQETKDALQGWLEVPGLNFGPLFTNFDHSSKGGRLSATSVWRIIRGFGLGHPHGLRHTAITEALDITGGDIRAVQRFSRHKDMRILTLYDDNRTDLGGQVARRVAARFSAF